jgi:phosphoribosylaminoimidazole-succinocarboxamide synthase
MSSDAISRTDLPLPLHRRGKVRDVYDLGDSYLFVATDRISAFDIVLSPGIPGKGIVLTQISNFWFRHFSDVENHLVETDFEKFPAHVREHAELRGRSVLVEKCQVIPVECVARGFIIGSGWKEYQATGSVCGIELPAGLELAERLREPIFTPATKADVGHDENIPFETMAGIVGAERAAQLREMTLSIYGRAASYAASRGIIIADTKFEFGEADGKLVWIDEALTPDSSRFWPSDGYQSGSNPPSYDKQYVRDWLESTGWDKKSEPPPLPEAVVSKTIDKYLEAYRMLTGEDLEL